MLNILGYEMDTAHAKFWKARHISVYTYDPADDGPEVYLRYFRHKELSEYQLCVLIRNLAEVCL